MGPTRRVRMCVLLAALAGLAALAAPASAQVYEAARRSLDLSPDPIARSPRLLGMGRLDLVVYDHNNRITLWDFAANPAGVVNADSGSTFELRPTTSSASDMQLRSEPGRAIERQTLAARETRLGVEGWRRTPGHFTTYGLTGDASVLRMDRPYDLTTERRSKLSDPNLTGILAGRMPYTRSGNTQYALLVRYGIESQDDEYHLFTTTANGEYIDQEGTLLPAPSYFTPDAATVSSTGLGGAVSQRIARKLTIALAGDVREHKIKLSNVGNRHESWIEEKRPVATGQLSLIADLSRAFHWGADLRSWTSSSQQDWRFSISAGIGGIPLAGRGKLLDRDETGRSARTRLWWNLGPFDLGAGFGAARRKLTITPPDPSDLTSFNAFRNQVFYRLGADTLSLPDSVVANASTQDTWDAGAGLAWHLPARLGLVGVEYHRDQNRLDQTLSGAGPYAKGWDVRTGLEVRCTDVLTARGGYVYRWQDADEKTAQNEFVSRTMTLGLGLRPANASWTLESGWSFAWGQADYGDPTQPHSGRQQLAAQVRWAF